MGERTFFALPMLILLCLLTACGHEHIWGDWEIIKEATCMEEGLKERACECGLTETETISKSGHSLGQWEHPPCFIYEYKICTICGEAGDSRVAENQHNCDETGVCLDCKEKVHYTIEDLKKIIQVDSITIGQLNSSGIHDLKIVWQNTSDKFVNEIVFTVGLYYNGEKVTQKFSADVVVEPGGICGRDTLWDEWFPSEGVKGEHIESIYIKYADWSSVTIPSSHIKYVMRDYE